MIRDPEQTGFTLVKQSAGKDQDVSCSPCRWGDYAGSAPDPTTSLSQTSGRIWLTGQYNVKSVSNSDIDWRTWIWEASP